MLELTFDEFPVLRTERLLLRQFDLKDAPGLFKMRSNPEVLRYVDREPMQKLEEAEVLINVILTTYQESAGISWAICSKDNEEFMGFAGLWRIIKEHFRAEIGYTLMPEYWNQGYMTEALRAIVNFGFREMRLHSIEANINPENTASIRIAEKVGFVREAYFKENYYFRGKFLDSAIYSLVDKS